MNKLIFTINKDSKGVNQSLNNLNIEGSEALEIFITNLNQYIRLKNNQDQTDLKISLTPGSVNTEMLYSEARVDIENDINSVLEGTSENNEIINIFKRIQDKIKLNGLDYDIKSINSSGVVKDLKETFKGDNFKKYRRKIDTYHKVEFVKGNMYNVGGKTNANLHIDYNDDTLTINCHKDQAKSLNNFLYSNVYLSILSIYKNDIRDKTELIDYYKDENTFIEYKDFYLDVISSGIEGHDIIYFKLKDLIKHEKYVYVRKIIRLFDVIEGDRGYIRTVLSTLKPYKDNEIIKSSFEELSNNLRRTSVLKRI